MWEELIIEIVRREMKCDAKLGAFLFVERMMI